MAKRTESELVVDLRGKPIETLDDFWDAVAEPCGLPEWFGRNTEAWRDTIQTRGISEVIDSYDVLVVHVDKRGIFAARNSGARALRSGLFGKAVATGRARAALITASSGTRSGWPPSAKQPRRPGQACPCASPDHAIASSG
ncbi:barstar family protein [Streptomyces sp. NPDC058794]|uniref:barstar family protein n=1 Tax=unclassified Streptomyces TaxID=2593676 RepID=UPI0036C8F718